jgi:hypothetical protein
MEGSLKATIIDRLGAARTEHFIANWCSCWPAVNFGRVI